MRFAAALLIALALRLLLAFALHGNYDQQSYEIVASITARGGNVYQETARYNYSPIWFQLIHVGDRVSTATAIPLHAVLRSFLSLIDLLDTLLIGLIARQWQGKGKEAAIVYAFNPGIIFIIGWHGQFEGLAMLPLLGVLALVTRHSSGHYEAQ